MADDWSNIALRFAVYVDLMVLFGVPLFAASALAPREYGGLVSRRYAWLAGAATLIGAILSPLGLMAMAKQMSGAADYASISWHVLQTILTRTGAGMAWAVRIAALAFCTGAIVALRGRPRLRFVALAGGGAVALVTLAWAGHGAMDEGARGDLHLAADAIHLLAAGAWLGALVAFVALFAPSKAPATDDLQVLARTALGFARVGTTVVLALAATGAINYLLTVGPSVQALVSTLYGRLLTAKLALFAAMLALAATNRYRLAPRLESALVRGEHRPAAGRALQRSLVGEASLALAVVALVAWLGVLSPDA